MRHGGRKQRLRALAATSFDVAAGQTLGIVGESGSGKSTLARALLRLTAADAGEILFRGSNLLALRGTALQRMRAHLQMIFQDGIAALDPRQRIGSILQEPLQIYRPHWSEAQRRASALAVLERVGLEARHLQRYPHECSGGQAQRIGIARALIVEPELIVCDEPLSALDVSIKAQIGELLQRLQRDLRLSLLFISRTICRPCNCYATGYWCCTLAASWKLPARDALFPKPAPSLHARCCSRYRRPTRGLRARVAPIIGDIPSSLSPPSGCVFRTRCPHAIERCARQVPPLRPVGSSQVACHRAEEI